jgi:transcriptional regulator with XRE-family HTH domain
MFFTAKEILAEIARRAHDARISVGLRQKDLADKAGVSLGTLRRFERTGDVGTEAVVKVAIALNKEREFLELFPPNDPRTLDEALRSTPKRSRVRVKS